MRTAVGATLIEVVITITLLALVFLTLLSLLPTIMASVRQSEHRLAAGALIQSIAERSRAADFNLLLGSDGVFDVSSPGGAGDLLRALDCSTNDAVLLQPTVTIGPVPPYDRGQICEIQVGVAWTDKSGRCGLSRNFRVANVTR